jgi:chromosomal replication initiation ATPase DnaA
MFVASYKNTQRGIDERHSAEWAEDRARRMAARRAAWEAEQAELEAIKLRKAKAEAQRLAMRAELLAMGVILQPPYQRIEQRALAVFDISRKDLHGDRRARDIVMARQFVSYWAVRLTSLSLPQIGRLMGGKDHTTILHGKRIYPEKRAYMGRHLRPAR